MGTVWKTHRLAAKSLDNSNECGVCPFTTGLNDPFLKCCQEHDLDYLSHETGSSMTKLEADQKFFGCMLTIAGESRWLRLKASLYYMIVRGPLGWIAWKF